MLRVIREVQPTWVVGENVLGLVNWSGGLVFEEVQADLEAQGYEVQPYVLPAAGVGAPHRRDRVWFVAYRNSTGRKKWRESNGWKDSEKNKTGLHGGIERPCDNGNAADTSFFGCNNGSNNRQERHIQGNSRASEKNQSKWNGRECRTCEIGSTIADTDNEGCEWDRTFTFAKKQEQISTRHRNNVSRNAWDNFPTQSPVCSRNDGLSDRLDGITFSKWRQESIKAYGNAIVPQVAYQIFKSINQYNDAIQS